MGDIRVNCGTCGQKYAVPDGITVMALKCLKCGTPVSLSSAASGDAKNMIAEPVKLTFARPPADGETAVIEREVIVDAPAVNEVVKNRRVSTGRDTSMLMGWLALLGVAGLMILFQWRYTEWAAFAPYYVVIRNSLLALVSLLLVLEAWEDGIGKGALSLFFPPYLVLYALQEADSRLVRGLFFGAVIALGAEVFLLPSHSLLMALGPALQGLTERVDGWIAVASREPI